MRRLTSKGACAVMILFLGAIPGAGDSFYELSDKAALSVSPDEKIGLWTKALLAWEPSMGVQAKAKATYNRARAFADKGMRAEAVGGYTDALRLDPRFAKAYNNRAVLRIVAGDPILTRSCSIELNGSRLSPGSRNPAGVNLTDRLLTFRPGRLCQHAVAAWRFRRYRPNGR